MASNIQIIGNETLLGHPGKMAFLPSRHISPADVLKCYEWAEKERYGCRCSVALETKRT